MPTGKRGVIVSQVGAVPAKYHIAKTKSFFGDRLEFLKADEFAPEYAIDVGDGYFHFGALRLREFREQVLNG